MKHLHTIITILLISMNTLSFASFIKPMAMTAAAAKGSAVTADTDSLDNIYKNPAGLSELDNQTISTSYSSYYNAALQVGQIGLNFVVPQMGANLTLSVPAKWIANIKKTESYNGKGVVIGSFSDIETAPVMALSKKFFDFLSIGASTTYYYNNINEITGSGIGFDAGLLLHLPLGITLGGSVQDIGGTTISWQTENQTEETISQTINAGIKMDTLSYLTLMADASLTDSKSDYIYNAGAVLHLGPHLDIQAGISDIEGAGRISLGTSLKWKRNQLHYTYQQHEELGTTHKVGLQYDI